MRKNSLYIISSLFFACVLFIYATYTNTVLNVPIDIQYDSDQYFISGFTSEVTVFLTGSNRVALASEMQESTRKFKVTADLSDASVGTIEVPLTIENLPSGLTAVATPQKITVKVGKTVSDEKVTVISDEETLSKVDRVIAILPTSERITRNYSSSVPLQAVDKNGNVLPSVIMPFDTTMKITTKTATSSSSNSSTSSSEGSSSSTSSETKSDSSKQ